MSRHAGNVSLLAKASKKDLIEDPFPYLVIKDVLSDELADQLIAEYPSLQTLAKGERYGSNHRFSFTALDARQSAAVSETWKEFVEAQCTQAFLDQAISVFGDAILKAFPSFETEFGPLKKLRVGMRKQDTFDTADVLLDAQICVNTPVFTPSSVRGAHLDNPDKLLFGLFYLRRPDDTSLGGELQIYRSKEGKQYQYGYDKNIDDDEFDLVETVPYKKNLLVLALNTPNAVHGVSPRSSMDVPRYFLNLVAEVKKPLFDFEKKDRFSLFLERYGFARPAPRPSQKSKTPHDLGLFLPERDSVLVLNPHSTGRALPPVGHDHNILFHSDIEKLSSAELKKVVGIIVGKGSEKASSELLARLPSLRIAGIASGSIKKSNPELFLERGIPITNVSEVYAEAVAEFALMHMLVGIRRAGFSHDLMRRGGWGVLASSFSGSIQDVLAYIGSRIRPLRPFTQALIGLVGIVVAFFQKFGLAWHYTRMRGMFGAWNESKRSQNAASHTLRGASVGIVGYGPVAQQLIALLTPFGCDIKVHSEYLSDAEAVSRGLTKASLADICACQVVSLHRGLSDRTRLSFSKKWVNALAPGTVLVNTSRGEIVDQDALVERLKTGDIVACLDVYKEEPLPRFHLLRRLQNVFLTSHIANSADSIYEKALAQLGAQVVAVLKGVGTARLIHSTAQLENMT